MLDSAELDPVTVLSADKQAAEGEPDHRSATAGPLAAAVVVALALIAVVAILSVTTRPPGLDPGGEPGGGSGAAPADRGGDSRRQEARSGQGPLLSEPVELVLAVGGVDRDVHVIDLDGGDVTSLRRPGTPRLISGDQLLLQDAWSRWELVDLDGGGAAERSPAPEDRAIFTAALPAESGGVWMLHPRGGDIRLWSRIDSTSGRTLEQVEVPTSANVVVDNIGRPVSGPELIGASTGGVYALQPDGSYRLVVDARLVAFSRQLILVAECDEQLRCSNRWLDRASLRPLDLPAPEQNLGGGYLRGDRVLVAETHTVSGLIVKVFDIDSGQAVATGAPGGLWRTWISPEGRFMAVPGFDALLITDLGNGRTSTLDDVLVDTEVDVVWGSTPES